MTIRMVIFLTTLTISSPLLVLDITERRLATKNTLSLPQVRTNYGKFKVDIKSIRNVNKRFVFILNCEICKI